MLGAQEKSPGSNDEPGLIFWDIFAVIETVKNLQFGGNGGIRTLDEALHPILP